MAEASSSRADDFCDAKTEGIDYYVSKEPDDVPENAVKLGLSSRGEVYVGTVKYRNMTLPCAIVPQNQCCYFSYCSREICLSTYSYVVVKPGYSYEWVYIRGEVLPQYVVTLGQKSGELLAIGSVTLSGEKYIGRVMPQHKTCYFVRNGTECENGDYDVLTVKRTYSELFGCDVTPGISVYHAKSHNDVPENAIKAGLNPLIYVGFAEYGDKRFKDRRGYYESMPAKINPAYHLVYYSYCGVEYYTGEHKFIVVDPGYTYSWVPDSKGGTPQNAVRMGRKFNGENFFVGRITVSGEKCVGKISTSQQVCYAPYGGREYHRSEYDVLIVNKVPHYSGFETPPIEEESIPMPAPGNVVPPGPNFDQLGNFNNLFFGQAFNFAPGIETSFQVPDSWTRKPFILTENRFLPQTFIDNQLEGLRLCLDVNEEVSLAPENEERVCVVCQVYVPTRVVTPCGHDGLCRVCVENVIRHCDQSVRKKSVVCPICRCLVHNFVIPYKST